MGKVTYNDHAIQNGNFCNGPNGVKCFHRFHVNMKVNQNNQHNMHGIPNGSPSLPDICVVAKFLCLLLEAKWPMQNRFVRFERLEGHFAPPESPASEHHCFHSEIYLPLYCCVVF